MLHCTIKVFFLRTFNRFLSSSLGGFQHASIIKQDLITFFVPFLPLERVHIRSCIRQQLKSLLEDEPYEYEYSEDKIVDEVLSLIEFSTYDSFEYSPSGCKRVEQKLRFEFEILRSKLKRKEKRVHENL